MAHGARDLLEEQKQRVSGLDGIVKAQIRLLGDLAG